MLPHLPIFPSSFLPTPPLSLSPLSTWLTHVPIYFFLMQLGLILANCVHSLSYFLTNRNTAVIKNKNPVVKSWYMAWAAYSVQSHCKWNYWLPNF